MKKSISLEDVTIPDLQEVLRNWADGSTTYVDVQSWAEMVVEVNSNKEWPTYAEDDPRSAVASVMTLLNWMYSFHIMKGDIPALQHFLQLYLDNPKEAWIFYKELRNNIDSSNRSDLPFE